MSPLCQLGRVRILLLTHSLLSARAFAECLPHVTLSPCLHPCGSPTRWASGSSSSGAREPACPLCLTSLQSEHLCEPLGDTSAHLKGPGDPELMQSPSGLSSCRKSTSGSMKWDFRICAIPTRAALTRGPRPLRRACAPQRESSERQRRSCRS